MTDMERLEEIRKEIETLLDDYEEEIKKSQRHIDYSDYKNDPTARGEAGAAAVSGGNADKRKLARIKAGAETKNKNWARMDKTHSEGNGPPRVTAEGTRGWELTLPAGTKVYLVVDEREFDPV